jgi:hypothetical protein
MCSSIASWLVLEVMWSNLNLCSRKVGYVLNSNRLLAYIEGLERPELTIAILNEYQGASFSG